MLVWLFNISLTVGRFVCDVPPVNSPALPLYTGADQVYVVPEGIIVLPDKLTVKAVPLHILAVWEGMTGVGFTVIDNVKLELLPHSFLAETIKSPLDAKNVVVNEIIFEVIDPRADQPVGGGDQL
jgi:hypothetical protein